ncbi:MAG: polymerase [Spirochaetaceae bacterium]|jgi:hypothetical protein|nr:polymerase [Spirochaetaceae bacterium]
MDKNRFVCFLFLVIPVLFLHAQESAGPDRRIEAQGFIAWEKMELSATVSLDLAGAGIILPTGRIQAEDVIRREYTALMRPYILALPYDSSSVLGDLVERGEFSFLGLEEAAASARRGAPVLSPDLSRLSAAFTIDMAALGAQFKRHRRPMDMPRVLLPVPAASWTGIVIIASERLPVHGRNISAYAAPCLFPRIWDSEMNLIYERNTLDSADSLRPLVRYSAEAGIFLDTPSGLSPELEAIVGQKPLRIMARGLFGIRPTDPLIDREDALLILSSENNRKLLREGRVVIVLSDGVLREEL